MKYYVTCRVEGRYECEVEANSIEEAIDIAQDIKFLEADFGDLTEVVDGYANIVEDEKGNIIWDKA